MPFETKPFDIGSTFASDLRLRAETIKEQVLVVDAVRAKPFCDETIH